VAGLAAVILEDETQRARVECAAELLLKVANLSDDEVDELSMRRISRNE
jgi:hypothetical protein